MLQRAGASAQVIERRQRQLAELAVAARAAEGSARESLAAIRGLSERCDTQRDPALMVEALSTRHPVMLMPVVVQTRYDDATTQADDPHLPRHAARVHARSGVDAERDRRRQALLERCASPTRRMQHLAVDADRAHLRPVARGLRGAHRPRRPTWTRSATPPSPRSTTRRSRWPPTQSQPVVRPGAAGPLRRDRAAQRQRDLPQVGQRGPRPAAAVAALRPAAGRRPRRPRPVRRRPRVDGRLRRGGSGRHGDHRRRRRTCGRRADEPGRATAARARRGLDADTRVRGRAGRDRCSTTTSTATGLKFVAQGTPTNNTGATRAGFAANGADVVAALDPVDQAAQQAAARRRRAGERRRATAVAARPAEAGGRSGRRPRPDSTPA